MKYILIGIAVAVLLGGGWYLTKNNRTANDSAAQPEDAPANSSTTSPEAANSEAPSTLTPSGTKIAANYYQYSQTDYEAARAAHRPIFLYFYANWCPTCAEQEPIVRGLMEEISDEKKLDDLIAFRVNFNDSDTDSAEEALAREFGVTYQHTMFVLDEDGNEYQKLLGQTSAEILRGHFSDVVGL